MVQDKILDNLATNSRRLNLLIEILPPVRQNAVIVVVNELLDGARDLIVSDAFQCATRVNLN